MSAKHITYLHDYYYHNNYYYVHSICIPCQNLYATCMVLAHKCKECTRTNIQQSGVVHKNVLYIVM